MSRVRRSFDYYYEFNPWYVLYRIRYALFDLLFFAREMAGALIFFGVVAVLFPIMVCCL